MFSAFFFVSSKTDFFPQASKMLASVFLPDNCKNKIMLCYLLYEGVAPDFSVHFQVPFHFLLPEFYRIQQQQKKILNSEGLFICYKGTKSMKPQ